MRIMKVMRAFHTTRIASIKCIFTRNKQVVFIDKNQALSRTLTRQFRRS